ncbi:MAG: TrkH family potassium uptake protein [Verrucomicrobiota bacterium]|nr:TrkH family potassium uptake protein [Verrucomicrobiota bacterium]
MNIKAVFHVISAILSMVGFCILSSVPVSICMGDEQNASFTLLYTALFTLLVGISGYFATKGETTYSLGIREGFGIVTFGWIIASAFGALPFIFVGNMHWYDAFFETMSGFSTTGASVLDSSLKMTTGGTLSMGIANLPNGLLFWRSLTHWLGGMGIVVLSLAIFPFLGIGGQSLYNAEVPGPTSDQLTPRIASSAKILWSVYLLLSIAETLLLYLGDMSLFDAWCHTCGTMATGGFSTQQSSVGAYNSPYIESVIILFMFLAGCNFVLHYRALRGKPLFYLKDEEFRFYFLVTLFAIITITFCLIGSDIVSTSGQIFADASFLTSFRFAAFQVVSILTTTGFATANFNLWPAYTTLLLVCLMFVGGCGGSTGGGMKNSRVLLLLKYGISQIQRCIFPNSLTNVRLNGERLDNTIIHKTLTFFFLFLGCFVIFTLLLPILCEMDLVTAMSASIASLGNIGPGLNKVGSTVTYSWMSPSAKMLLTIAMLIGRLEIYTVLVIILPSFWKK